MAGTPARLALICVLAMVPLTACTEGSSSTADAVDANEQSGLTRSEGCASFISERDKVQNEVDVSYRKSLAANKEYKKLMKLRGKGVMVDGMDTGGPGKLGKADWLRLKEIAQNEMGYVGPDYFWDEIAKAGMTLWPTVADPDLKDSLRELAGLTPNPPDRFKYYLISLNQIEAVCGVTFTGKLPYLNAIY